MATDADPAGQTAAERDYWILSARGADPQHVAFPAGHDPASILRAAGPQALADRLGASSKPLAEALVDERLNHLPHSEALPAAAAVVAAGPPVDWHTRTAALARRLHLPVDAALTELIAQASRWDGDRHTALQAQLQNVRELRDQIAAHSQLPDTERWAPLARQIDPVLVRTATWPPLAAAFTEAEQAGHDLPTLLRDVLAHGPLHPSNPGLDLQSRLVADLDPQPTPAGPHRPGKHAGRTHSPGKRFATQPSPPSSSAQIIPSHPGADGGPAPEL